MKPVFPIILFLASVLSHSITFAQTGSLWGMTATNGSVNGVIFKTDSAGGSYSEVYSFSLAAAGIDPFGSLMQATDGKLYGMTSRGGANGYGVIFQVDPVTGAYIKKHDFDSVNGKRPYGSLCQAINGKLYGMTFNGGPAPFPGLDRGVIFEYDPAANVFTKKADLLQENMGNAYGSLIVGSDGKLYGLSSVGGGDATGALFSYDIQTGDLGVKESFIAGPVWEGYEPMGDLVQAGDGRYYGLSRHGGAGPAGGGVLFRYDPNASMFNRMDALHHFSEDFPTLIDGHDLTGSLVQAANGKLYGMTRRGGIDSAGTIFSFDISSNTFAKVHDFDSTTEGYAPHGSLMLAADGKLYGLITSPNGQARLFLFNTANNGIVIKSNVTGTPYYTKLVQQKSTTTVRELTNAGYISVYPNPAADKLYIGLDEKYTSAQLQIISSDGRVVIEREVNSKNKIDVHAVPAGTYFIKLSADGAILRYTPIVIAR